MLDFAQRKDYNNAVTLLSRESDSLSNAQESRPGKQEPPTSGSIGGSPVSKRTGRPPSTTPRKRCEWCSEPYVPYRNVRQQRYCSRECARKAMAHTGWWTDHGLRGQDRVIQQSMSAQRAIPRSVEIHQVRADDGKRYYARDADALLEEISDSEQARPGLWYG